jgi:hypothetical protein
MAVSETTELEVELPPVGWVEPRNPTTPALTERSIKIIGHLFTIPILLILNIKAMFDHVGDVGFHSSTQPTDLPSLHFD